MSSNKLEVIETHATVKVFKCPMCSNGYKWEAQANNCLKRCEIKKRQAKCKHKFEYNAYVDDYNFHVEKKCLKCHLRYPSSPDLSYDLNKLIGQANLAKLYEGEAIWGEDENTTQA